MQIIIEDSYLADVPVMNVYNVNQTGRLPVVIVLHGLSSHKENNLKPAYKLARAGFFVVLFDALEHGERQTIQLDQLSPVEKYREILKIQLDSVQTIAPLIANCRNNPRANPNKVGLLGFSMGGNSVYKYIAEPMPENVKAAVAFSATPCWSTGLHQMAPSLAVDLLAEVREIEPYQTIGNLVDFPLLMVNGTKDEVFAIDEVRQCYRELYANYTQKEYLVQLEYPQNGHLVTDEMLTPAIDWLQRFLK